MSLASPSLNRTNTPSELSLASLSSQVSSSSTQTASSTAASTFTASSEWTEGVQNEQSLQISESAHSSEDGSLANSAIIKMDAEVELPDAASIAAEGDAETQNSSWDIKRMIGPGLLGSSCLQIIGAMGLFAHLAIADADGSLSETHRTGCMVAEYVLFGTSAVCLIAGAAIQKIRKEDSPPSPALA